MKTTRHLVIQPEASTGFTLDELRAIVDETRDMPGNTVPRGRVVATFSPYGGPIQMLTFGLSEGEQ